MRIVGQAPLQASVYELDRLRCNLCGEVFTAEEPEDVGPEKYDETTAAMIALLKYGSGMPFYRLEKLEHLLGIPLSASTQWEIVEEAAEVIKAARDELIRQAAQGEVLHNDDTSMRVLRLAREPSDDRTGVFTSGMVSTKQGQRIALYFTGRQHAGENLRDVLEHRVAELARPIQMCRPGAKPHWCPYPGIRSAFIVASGRPCRATHRNSVTVWRSCWPTAWRTEDGSLWKWPQTSRNHVAMFWRRWATYINRKAVWVRNGEGNRVRVMIIRVCEHTKGDSLFRRLRAVNEVDLAAVLRQDL